MKKGFTMIELIFVIVILGILAAVAIPKLAATRDDAKLAAIKTDIGTFINAIPAWYQGQKDARIAEAVSLDTKQWKKNSGEESYTLTIDDSACVTIAVWDMNGTNGTAATANNISSTNGTWSEDNVSVVAGGVPTFRIIKGDKDATYSGTTVCDTLWDVMGVTEQNITMAGKKVVW